MFLKLAKVLVLDGIDKTCEAILSQADIDVTVHSKMSKDELIRQINTYDGIIVRSATKITEDIIRNSKRLKIVGRAGTGVDNIDVDACTQKGILVMNTPFGNTLSAAEHTCSMICSLSRSIPQACATLKEGHWDRKKFMGNELNEKVLAIVGLGKIGKEVSDRMKSFGMRVIGYDPIVSPETAASWGIEYLPLEKIWPLADYITVHTPLIPQTRYLINESVIQACKPTVRIVNVARGGIVEEKALLEALKNGTCGGAALDVFEEEPPKDLSLLRHPKVICTPHLGANTHEAQKRVAIEIAEQFVSMSQGKQMIGVVNAPALGEVGSPLVQPWLKLSSSLGTVASKLVKNGESVKIQLQVYGERAERYTKILVPSLLKGYLQPTHADVNLVNSLVLAKTANIDVTATGHKASKKDSLDLSNYVELLIQSGSTKYSLKGSASGQKSILYSINDCLFPSGVTLDNNMIFYLTSKPQQTCSSVVTTLQNASLLALFLSTTSEDKVWIAARTGTPFESTPVNESVDLMFQIQF